MTPNEFGMKAWGVATVVLAVASLAVVVLGGAYLGLNGALASDTPRWIGGMYLALKDCGTIVAGIIGFSGLAWSNFYVASSAAYSSAAEGKKSR